MRSVHAMVRDRGTFFPLLDEQREAFRRIAHAVDQKFTENDKNVFIVIGGPGTGKSVLGPVSSRDQSAGSASVTRADPVAKSP